MDEPAAVDIEVMCGTPSCQNFGVAIIVSAPESNPFVVCGPCGATITDNSSISVDDGLRLARTGAGTLSGRLVTRRIA